MWVTCLKDPSKKENSEERIAQAALWIMNKTFVSNEENAVI